MYKWGLGARRLGLTTIKKKRNDRAPAALLRVLATHDDTRVRLWRQMKEWDWGPLVACLRLQVRLTCASVLLYSAAHMPHVSSRRELEPGASGNACWGAQ